MLIVDPRNFSPAATLHTFTTAPFHGLLTESVYALRSLLALSGPVEIPRRFSSSSLPPSFVSGRFAGFYLPAYRATGV